MKKFFFIAIAVSIGAVSCCFVNKSAKAAEADAVEAEEPVVADEDGLSIKPGEMFKDFTVIQDPAKPASSTVKFSDFVGKGKYILVDFWASWCPPCRAEIPVVAKVYEKYAGENFDVLSVAVSDDPKDTRKAAAELGVKWNSIINAQRIPGELYGIRYIPQIMLFGPDGKLIAYDLREDGIEKAVKAALGK
ncbi:MAG: TlpA family protein disulfide reductase [Bacteroidales bacterium]|nr:TlpA family protein disulfide reductase [Bacteroidales bacterium]